MTILYNCKPMHTSGMYNITKFDDDMNVVSSYVTTITGDCDCPRGPHPTCRHRQMLPKFISRQHVGDEWFLDFDRGGWVQMGPEYIGPTQLEASDGQSTPELDGLERDEYLAGIMERDLPEGVTMIVMDHPDKVVDVHNAIADAVGEPHAIIPKHIPRRLG